MACAMRAAWNSPWPAPRTPAQLEHATDRAAKIYRRQAERRRLADQGQAKIDRVVEIRAVSKAKREANRA
jgi:hypothetical protein